MEPNVHESIPYLPDNIQTRPFLLDKLQQGRQKRLTLVSAPAGFGKTTLLIQWAIALKAEGWRVLWHSASAQEGENGRFFQNLWQNLPLSIESNQQVSFLVAQLKQSTQPVALFFDDFHHLKNETIQKGVQHLLIELPTHVHVVIGTRQKPALQLARWRANQQLAELTQHDLSFSVAETAVFFKKQPTLSTEMIEQMTERTEGWIAGLQLVRLMLNTPQITPQNVLQALNGTQQTIFDYLSEEAFQQQPLEIQRFLLQTSILEQLSPALCNAVVSRNDSQIQLARLVTSHLFINRLDPSGQWFRYHHLFAEFLQRRLTLEMADQLPQLHKRASLWFQQQGNAPSAVHHAAATDDQTFLLDTLSEQASSLMRDGDSAVLVYALHEIPNHWLEQRPRLALHYIFAHILQGKTAVAQTLLDTIWPQLSNKHLGTAFVIQSEIAKRQGQTAKMLEMAEKAQPYLEETPRSLKQLLGVNLANLYSFQLGKNKAALDLLKPIYHDLQQTNQPYLFFHCANLFGATLVLQGELRAAFDLYQQVLAVGEQWQMPSLLGAIHTGIGKLYLERYELDQAEYHLRAGLQASRRMKANASLISNAVVLARLLWAKGEPEQAQQLLAEARRDALESPMQLPRLTHWHRWRKADNGWIGVTVAATQSLNQEDMTQPTYSTLFSRLKEIQLEVAKLKTQARLTIPVHQLRSGLHALSHLAQSAGQIDTCLDIYLTQIVLEERLGNTAVAQQHLFAALTLAKSQGYLFSFFDIDPIPSHLLKKCYSQGSLPPDLIHFAERILTVQSIPLPNFQPADPLTPREKEVLTLLGDGLTNQAIAEQLHLSVGTVRWHARNIYSKLSAANRTHAVARARHIGLLS